MTALITKANVIWLRDVEIQDHTLEAKYSDEWVDLLVTPHSLRVVNELIAWRNRNDHYYYKIHKAHLYPPYRAKKL